MYKIFVKSTLGVISTMLVSSEATMTKAIDVLEADQNVSDYAIYHLEQKVFHSRSMYLLHTENTIEKWRYPVLINLVITGYSVWSDDEYREGMGDSLTHDVKRIQISFDWVPEDYDLETLVELWEGSKGPEDYPFIIIEC